MGNAQMKTLEPALLPVANPFEVAFTGAYETFANVLASHAGVKADAKASAEVVATAKRVVCWAAFDLAGTDLDRAQDLAVLIATEEGVKTEALPVMRQRARDSVVYRVAIAKADRAKVNPYSLAKTLRVKANEAATTASANAPFISEAFEMAAGVLSTTIPDLQARVMAGDAEARTVFEAALVDVKGRVSLIEEYKAIMGRLAAADEGTRAACGFQI